MTPLHLSASYNNIKVTELLIKQNADLNAMDNSNMTPLNHAIQESNLYIIDLLTKNGANQ